MSPRSVFIALLCIALLAACGGGPPSGADPTAASTSEATSAPAATTEAKPAATAAATTDWKTAVVRIVAAGSVKEPTVAGTQLSIGSGSGFIIGPSGLVVTNNHVVTGTGLQKVYVDGHNDPYNAHVLGASECSDLAVIQIDSDGETFPTLQWYKGDIATGLKVYAAGYPGGDPQFSLTDGIISRLKVNGDTEWASVRSVFAHTAKILPGSSGGPLVTEDGQVVGINYAGVNATDQNYAIDRNGATKIIETLQTKQDVSSIGINGTAVKGKLGGQDVSGIWVRSVKSGSLADKALLKPGDLITTMEGLPLGQDETMAVYCDIIRDRSTETLTIKVLRTAGNQIQQLEGQINGRELAADGQPVVVAQGSGATPLPAAQAAPAPEPSGTHLGMSRDNQNGDANCIAVQIRGIVPDNWALSADGIALTPARFDDTAAARLCGARLRRGFTFTILNAQGAPVQGGGGIPAKGGDVFVGVWQ